MQFSKYHGTGNDFIMVNSRKNDSLDLSPERVAKLCDRHFGIGADGLIVLEESENYDFKMLYFNSDGYPGTMCGNGGRCITAFAKHEGWIEDNCTFEAADGTHQAEILNNGKVRLELRDVSEVTKNKYGFFLNTGSPHLVIFTQKLSDFSVLEEGRYYRNLPDFKGGTNVNFVEIEDKGIRVRTFERGVENETLSCGTGVTASAMAASIFLNKKEGTMPVSTPGGKLQVDFKKSAGNLFTSVFLTGPVEIVFKGEFTD